MERTSPPCFHSRAHRSAGSRAAETVGGGEEEGVEDGLEVESVCGCSPTEDSSSSPDDPSSNVS